MDIPSARPRCIYSDAVATTNGTESDQGVNPKFDLSYSLDKDLLLYGTAAKGFRPGGANQPITAAIRTPHSLSAVWKPALRLERECRTRPNTP
jgi:outer membrane receptor protein involved in Fe transport